ncbi:MAG: hypothetical protein DVB31_13330, partial [Verrucomicrobia bacterium]
MDTGYPRRTATSHPDARDRSRATTPAGPHPREAGCRTWHAACRLGAGMAKNVNRRITLFALALVIAAATLLWAGVVAWMTAGQLGGQLSEEQVQSFSIGDEFNADLRHLQSLLVRCEIQRDGESVRLFETAQTRLDQWLAVQEARIRRPVERELLNRIDRVYDRYAIEARALIGQIQTNAPHDRIAPFRLRVDESLKELGELDSDLLAAHEQALEQAVNASRARLKLIQWIVLGALAAIIVLVALLAVFVWRDLIEPLRLRLVESQDLIARQEKLASLGVLAAGVAHEIRNPLTAIKARLYTQQKSLPAGSAAAEHAAVISREINRLERIVRGFLDFARPADPNPEPLGAHAVLAEVRDLLAPAWEKDGVVLRVKPGDDVRFEADRAQLKQVLI